MEDSLLKRYCDDAFDKHRSPPPPKVTLHFFFVHQKITWIINWLLLDDTWISVATNFNRNGMYNLQIHYERISAVSYRTNHVNVLYRLKCTCE